MYSFDSHVRYSEVNSEKKLTLPALLDYLQDCCIFQSEDLGIGVDYLEREQIAWILSSWQIEISRYPQLGEKITVSTWPYYFKGFYGYRNFTVKDETGDQIAAANSIWVFMDIARMRPAKINDTVAARYQPEIEKQLEGDWAARKLAVPEGEWKKAEAVQVARYHIDTNHHMNNGKYIQIAETMLPEDFCVKSVRAEYKKSAMLGDWIYPAMIEEKEKTTVVLAEESGTPYAVVEFLK